MRLALATAASAAVLNAAAAAPAPTRPLMPIYDAAGITKACEEGPCAPAQDDRRHGREDAAPAPSSTNGTRSPIDIEDGLNPIYLLSNVHPDKAVRDAAEPCLQKYTTLQTEIFQDEKLYSRVNAAQPDESAPGQAEEGPARGLRG